MILSCVIRTIYISAQCKKSKLSWNNEILILVWLICRISGLSTSIKVLNCGFDIFIFVIKNQIILV